MNFNSSKTIVQGLSAVFLLLVFSIGCSFMKQLASKENTNSGVPVFPSSPQQTPKGENLYESAEALQAFLSSLRETVGAENPNVLKVVVYDSYAMAQVQDPKKPENIDGYTYRDGKMSAAAPVKIMGNGKIEDNIFALNGVNFAALPALTKEIKEKLKDVEGSKMIGYTINRQLPFSKNIEIYALTDAARKSVRASADANGKLTKFEVK